MHSQEVILGAVWGTAVGIFYFGGLWLTVRRVHKVIRPGRLLLLSFSFRATAAVLCFLLILRQGVVMFAATLLFFFLVRLVITGLLGKPVQGGIHAN